MKKRIIAVSLALMSLCLSANADVVQALTINGQTVEKTVTQLTFSDDNVVLHFEGSEESYALDDVVLDFSDVSSINSINTFKLNGLVDGRLDISGLAAGTPVAVFDISGKKMASLRAGEETTQVNVGDFRSGVYILKAGTQIVKFVKR